MMSNQVKKPVYALNSRGWTLMELLIAIAIIAIIAAAAFPTYQSYVIKESRTEVQTELTKIAQNLENYKLANNNTYAGATLSNSAIYGSTQFTSSGVILYNLLLTTTATSWTLDAQPINRQAGDGDVMLNDQGQRCWTQGSSTCSLGSASVWKN